MLKTAFRLCLPALLALSLPLGAQAQNLRIGLAEDADVLDPTLARTFVGRIVFAALCDKLFDIDEKLAIVPPVMAWMRPPTYSWRSGLAFSNAK